MSLGPGVRGQKASPGAPPPGFRHSRELRIERPSLILQPSEAVVIQAAATLYAAYQTAGRLPAGSEQEWMRRAVQEAFWIARTTDDAIRSDGEMG